MTIALVQQVFSSTASGGSASKTITIATPTAGNALRLIAGATNGKTISSVSGGGVTWTPRVTTVGATRGTEIWDGDNSSGSGTTITVVVSDTYARFDINVSEWSGMPTTVAPDGSGSNTGGSGTPSTASVTPTAGLEILLLAVMCSNGSSPSGPSSSFTAMTNTGNTRGTEYGYLIVSSASGSYSTSWTVSPSYASWATAIAAWDGASGGGGGGGGSIIGGGNLIGGDRLFNGRIAA